MPVQVSYPGVYVQEVPSGVQTVTGVSTSIAAFIGMTTQGPLNAPRRVLSFADYVRLYGVDIAAGEMTDQVRQFFVNGGQQAFIMRIANGAQAARVELKDETGGATVLTLEAKSAGTIGESIRVEVDYNTSKPESTFNLRVLRVEVDAGGVSQVAESETFKDLTMNPNGGTYVVNVLNEQSNLVTATAAVALPAAIAGFSIAGVLMATASAGTGTGVTEIQNIIDNLPNNPNRKGRFQISVDGSPFVTAEIDRPASDTDTDIGTAIADPINLALAPLGRSVTVSVRRIGPPVTATHQALRIISSNTTGGSVHIIPATMLDIAVPMQMGSAQGGLEVDGFAVQRPAPSGYFSVLGTDLADLIAFINTDPATVTALGMVDATNTASGASTGPLTWPAAGNVNMSFGSLPGNSLSNVKENLTALVAAINSSPIQWLAALHGFRVVLTPEFDGPDADFNANITTTGGTNLGASSAIFGANSNVRQYRLGSYGATKGKYQEGTQAGSNGVYPQLQHYQDAFPIIDQEVDLFNIMILPRAKDQGDDVRTAVWSPASVFCQARRAFLLVDPRATWDTIDKVTDGTTGIGNLRNGLVKDHAAVYWPPIRIPVPEGGERTIDPSGSIAGLMARTDSNRGVWKAPAGIEATLRGVRGVKSMIADSENGVINPEAVNAIRVFPNGIVSWGARTMDGFDNSGNNDYKYVPVRRIALFIEESLYRGLKFAVFEPNDEPLWAQIRWAQGRS